MIEEENLKDHFDSFSNLIKLRLKRQAMETYYHDDIQILDTVKNITTKGKDTLLEEESELMKDILALSTSFFNVVIDVKKEKVWGEIEITKEDKTNGKDYSKRAFFQKWKDGLMMKQKLY